VHAHIIADGRSGIPAERVRASGGA
jgi:hypothetical protein